MLLEETGVFFKADRSYVFLIDHTGGVIRLAYEWCREGIEPELGKVGPASASLYNKWLRELSGRTAVYHKDIRKLPTDILSATTCS